MTARKARLRTAWLVVDNSGTPVFVSQIKGTATREFSVRNYRCNGDRWGPFAVVRATYFFGATGARKRLAEVAE